MAYYIAEGAVVKGQVTMADGASVWYNATVRGDSEPIEIGRNSNIQDNAVVHVDLSHSVRIGDNVTIGHSSSAEPRSQIRHMRSCWRSTRRIMSRHMRVSLRSSAR